MELQDILDKHSGAKARIDAIKKKELNLYFEPKIKEIILKTASEPDFPQTKVNSADRTQTNDTPISILLI